MGWVNDKFDEKATYAAEVPRLWKRMRDSIAEAVSDFNHRTNDAANNLNHTDCRAKGNYCTRIQKSIDNSSIEIYLDESAQSLNASRGGHTAHGKVCGYRISGDRKGAEFFAQDAEGIARAISVEEACKLAIAEFIFPAMAKQ
jgi:hypothetical protein